MEYIFGAAAILLILAAIFTIGYFFRRNNPNVEKKVLDKIEKKVK